MKSTLKLMCIVAHPDDESLAVVVPWQNMLKRESRNYGDPRNIIELSVSSMEAEAKSKTCLMDCIQVDDPGDYGL